MIAQHDEYSEGCDVFVHKMFGLIGMYCPCVPDAVVTEHGRYMTALIMGADFRRESAAVHLRYSPESEQIENPAEDAN